MNTGIIRKSRKTAEERRQEVIEAAIKAIGQKGLTNTTLADIAKLAGIGYGNLSFRFRNKDLLLMAALRSVVDEYVHAIESAAATPGGAFDRLDRVIMTAFSRQLTTKNKLAVWAAFWAEAHTRAGYLKLFSAFREKETERAIGLCRGIIEERDLTGKDAKVIGIGLNALIEGLWSGMAHGGSLDREEGLDITKKFVSMIFNN